MNAIDLFCGAGGMSLGLETAEALDAGIELAAAPADSSRGWGPYGSDDPDLCWRCVARLGAEPSGLCGSCLTIMRDDDYVAPDDTSEADLAESAARFFYTTPGAARVMLGLPDPGNLAVRISTVFPPYVSGPLDHRPDDQVDYAAAFFSGMTQRLREIDPRPMQELARLGRSFRDAATAVSLSLSAMARALGAASPRVPVPAKLAHRRRYGR